MKKVYLLYAGWVCMVLNIIQMPSAQAQSVASKDSAYWQINLNKLYTLRETDLDSAVLLSNQILQETQNRYPILHEIAQCEQAFILGKQGESDAAYQLLTIYLPRVTDYLSIDQKIRFQNFELALRQLTSGVNQGELIQHRDYVKSLPLDTPHYYSILWRTNRMLTNFHFAHGEWGKAIEYLYDNLQIADQAEGFKQEEVVELYNLGCAFFHLNEKGQSEIFFQRSLESACSLADSYENRELMAKATHFIGAVYQGSGNHEAWITLTEEAITVFGNLGSEAIISPLLDLSDYYSEKKEFKRARNYLKRAEQVMDQDGEISDYNRSSIFTSKALLAFKREQFEDAAYWEERAYTSNHEPETRIQTLKSLSTYYAAAGDYQKAHQKLVQHIELYATGVNEAQVIQTKALNESYEILEQKSKSQNLLEKSLIKDDELATQRAIILWGVLGMCLVIALAFYLFRMSRKLNISNRQLVVQTRQYQLAKEAAERASKARAEFLSVMSHEIRTPMNGVIGMADLLSSTQLTEEQRSFLRTINVSAESLMTIINDILDFSKIESGKLEIEQAPFSPRTAIEDVLELFSGKAFEAGLDLVYEVDEAVPATIIGDSVRLKQVISNLVNNAIKFTASGDILVSARIADPEAEKLTIAFDVRDTGIGIPLSNQHKLFKAFSQMDASTTRKYGGTGLGLAISARLTEAMGGKIWVESEQDKGSTFSFTICTKQAPQPELNSVFEASGLLKGQSILVIDDNVTNREVIGRQLSEWGMQVMLASSGPEGLSMLQVRPGIDMILVDMHMRGMDGLIFHQEVCKEWGEKTFRSILMSTVGHPASDIGSFDGVITKPIKRNALAKVLAKALGDTSGQELSQQPSIQSLDIDFASLNPLSILVAEDNMINQKLIINSLAKLGYEEVELARNGKEAVAKMNNDRFDLILMDVQMPVMDGLEATIEIRNTLPESRQPVIISMTASAMPEDQEACTLAGMQDHLSKPFRSHQLKAILQKYAIFAQEIELI